MDQVLEELAFACRYIDDAIIVSDMPKEHVKHLRAIFEELQKWRLHLHHGKGKFFHDRLPYLGHKIVPKDLEFKRQR
jgi:hypothetical protein